MRRLDDADVARHAELLENRLTKRARHLSKRFRKAGIEAYRLYDWDIPEVRATVDWYAGHLVAAEYTREQTAGVEDYLGRLIAPGATALGVPPERVHLKYRHTGQRGERYPRLDHGDARIEVREGDLTFLVNLDDYIDTGLFPDHRLTRARVRDESQGKAVLNLFGYTGSFTCYAAAGGASRTTTVDTSAAYLAWAQDNLARNKLADPRHRLVREDVITFLRETRGTWDLAIVDPPSFSSRGGDGDFDVQRDHGELLYDVLQVMNRGGRIYFSTNHQRFDLELEGLVVEDIREITDETVPEDYRNQQVHRCFLIEV